MNNETIVPLEGKEVNRAPLITLPYAPNALEPVISQETIEYHHGKIINWDEINRRYME